MGLSEWKEVRLKELIEFNPREKLSKGTRAKKIGMNKLETFNKQITDYEMTEYKSGSKFRNGDTLLARITPCLENGKTAQVNILESNEVGFGSTEFIVLREVVGKSTNDFIYYLAISPKFRDIAIKSMTGTTGRQRAQKDVLQNTVIKLPQIDEQKVIAEVLSSFEEKIQNNIQINKTLENITQTIFEQWFINFEFPTRDGNTYKSSGGEMVSSELGEIPKGWKIVELRDIAEFQNGYAFYKKGYSDDGVKVVDLANVNTLGEFIETDSDKYISNELAHDKKMEKFMLLKDDLVMIMTDRTQSMNILGKTGKIPYSNKYILNQRVGRIRTSEHCNVNYLRSILNSKRVLGYLKSVSLGSVQKYVNTNHIKDIQLMLPPKEIMDMYSEKVKTIFDKMQKINEENKVLKELLHTLLPKLISGEVRVLSKEFRDR
ncbi:restriction endonuclease subunit S [Halobacillus trueperi]|uniref:Restriction endonuclease subunit S n=1 Tax=Halobacillus trueperi TaxID=156205 RepID=A0A3D8VNF7_9BACI|nr:restriction endonuclease subunit S [Halobacillus trueperi]RDY70872.1 restriction endonuclease subunit S [Halobacillus trueperi]